MKSNPRISTPVLLLGTVAVSLTLLVVWLSSPRTPSVPAKPESEPPVVEATRSKADLPTTAIAAAQPLPTGGELPPVIAISLKPVLAVPENESWDSSDSFKLMPRGKQEFGGIEFLLEGLIRLQSKATQVDNRSYREKIVVPLSQTNRGAAGVEIVQRGSNVAAVHLLGATRNDGGGEVTVAELVWRYVDGSAKRTPIRFENHVRDWVRAPYETPAYLPYTFSKVVWRAPTPGQPERMTRLYRFSYPNPEPTKTIRQLEFVSVMATPSLFVVGLTLDPVGLGERPDDSPNLEPSDPTAPSQLNLFVQSAEGQAIPNATLSLIQQQVAGKEPKRLMRTFITDVGGFICINYPPPQDLDRLDISASHDDYGSRKMVWSPVAGDIIPENYTLKLSGGITIGGFVLDSSDSPIADAKISLNRFWRGGEEMNKKGEQANFPSQTQTTDAQGRWQAKGLPAELLDRIGLRTSHPEFVQTNLTVGDNPAVETKLRDGTHKIVMQRGLIVRGKVTDEQDRPIPDARVWAGRPSFSGTQETKTDAQGVFNFGNLKEGESQFSVLAKGRKPEVKTASVKLGMEEIVFTLGPGHVIRGIVKNEAGEPVSGVRIALESPTGGVAQDYQLDMNSDKDGLFEWDGAPDEPLNFCFLKTGYEAKRRQRLKRNEENLVTLRKGRQVQGWVLDAETEKPITKFRVGVGRYLGADSFYADYPGVKDYADANGAFSLDLSEEESSGIKAEADDYAEQIQKLPEAQNGVVQVILRLKPSSALRAVLVTPEGTPVPGATVGLTSGKPGPGMSAYVKNGRLTDSGRQSKIVTTDASGQFVLSSPPESGMVVGTAEMGFALAPIQQVRDSGRLVLQTFGQIEGTFKIGGQPVAGQEFLFSMMNAGISLDFGTYKATTDEAGRFTINKVPPGEGQIVRLVKTLPNSWMHSHNTTVVVEPGKTTQIALGDSGAVLKGHVSFETPLADDERLTISGRLSTQMPERPSNFQTPDEARAFFDSPEWKERMKQVKNFAVSVNADGSLTLDSIPPGTYTLNVTASKAGSRPFENPPVAQGRATVTIPDGANPYSPINLGEITLKPPPQPGVRP